MDTPREGFHDTYDRLDGIIPRDSLDTPREGFHDTYDCIKEILTGISDTLREGFHNTYDGIKDLFTNTNDPGFWHEAFEGGMHAVGTVGVLGIGYLGSILAGKAYTAVTGLFNKNEVKSEANA